MTEWGLTDDELATARQYGLAQWIHLPVLERNMAHRGDYEARAVEKAAQKKIVAWLNDLCFVYEGPCGKCGEDVYDDSVCCFRARDIATLGVKL